MRSIRTSLVCGVLILSGVLVGSASAAPRAAGLDSQEVAAATNILDTIGITRTATRAKTQIRGGYSFKGDEMPESGRVATPGQDAVDDVPLRMPDTSGDQAELRRASPARLTRSTRLTRRRTRSCTSSGRRPTARVAARSRCSTRTTRPRRSP